MISYIGKKAITVFYLFCILFLFPALLTPIAILGYIFGYKFRTWEINSKLFEFMLGIKKEFIGDQRCIDNGFIIPNHRTFTDFYYDAYVCKGSVVGRTLAAVVIMFYGLLAIIDKRIIIIDRTNKRDITFAKIMTHRNSNDEYAKRTIFYPEGTRLKHKSLASVEEAKQTLKPGLLKSIYEYKIKPVQLMITSNKEKVLDEKRLEMNYGIKLITKFSKPIYPSTYTDFDAFYDQIANEWYKLFNEVMKND